ncbi:MAG: NADH-quinone oxidoreductase subunit J family protein [Vulcanimicrobiaceae bacterium]
MIAFWVLGVVLIASAMWTITAKKPVYSVVGLLAHFVALAAMYLTLSGEFIAVIQIIVYSGAILVLFLFVIALLSSGVAPFATGVNRLPRIAGPAIAVALVGLGFAVYAIGRSSVVASSSALAAAAAGPVGTADVFGSVDDFGKALFTTYLLPFEITALILMVAVIGVVMLAGDSTPYAATEKRARDVRKNMREAILRGGER